VLINSDSGGAVDDTDPKLFHTMADGVVVVRAGWAEKEGKVFKTWKRRFFVLRSATPAEAASGGCTHTLLYYKKIQQASSGYVGACKLALAGLSTRLPPPPYAATTHRHTGQLHHLPSPSTLPRSTSATIC
jgi:hypothetical protein